MSDHLRFLPSDEWCAVQASLRQAMENGKIWTDPRYRMVADHIQGVHAVGVLSSKYSMLLREHHAALLSGEIELEDLTIPVL